MTCPSGWNVIFPRAAARPPTVSVTDRARSLETKPETAMPGTYCTLRRRKPVLLASAVPERRPAARSPARVARPAASSSPMNWRRTSTTVAAAAATVFDAFVRPGSLLSASARRRSA